MRKSKRDWEMHEKTSGSFRVNESHGTRLKDKELARALQEEKTKIWLLLGSTLKTGENQTEKGKNRQFKQLQPNLGGELRGMVALASRRERGKKGEGEKRHDDTSKKKK